MRSDDPLKNQLRPLDTPADQAQPRKEGEKVTMNELAAAAAVAAGFTEGGGIIPSGPAPMTPPLDLRQERSIRDDYAMVALTGIIASGPIVDTHSVIETNVRLAYKYADTALRIRGEK